MPAHDIAHALGLSLLTIQDADAAIAVPWKLIFDILMKVVGGLGIFLLGMKYMSEGMQAIAGNSLRRLIAAVTDNRFFAVGTGTAVTCMVQSSSITTVMVVGFVNSGLMALHQAIGVIMGANIGTTITGWILVLKIGKYGLPILGVAGFFYLFTKRERLRFIAMAIMGVGMVFFGLELMKNGFKPLTQEPFFQDVFAWFIADSYFGVLKCAMVGCLLTFIVQSSSATLAITIGLATTGVIPFETAAALVLGENIGTTITAWLASRGATTNAKRAAYAHVFFNLIGVAWITAIFFLYVPLIDIWVNWEMGEHAIGLDHETFIAGGGTELQFATILAFGIASVHTVFNVVNTLMFLPFVRLYARFLEWLLPVKSDQEQTHLTSLDVRMLETPVMALQQSHGELLIMSTGVSKMMDWIQEIMRAKDPDDRLIKKVFHREEVLDQIQMEIIVFLTDLLSANIPHSATEEARQQLRVADEFESISDGVIAVLKAHLKAKQAGHELSDAQHEDLNKLHRMVDDYITLVSDGFRDQYPEVITKARSNGDAITHKVKELRNDHLVQLSEVRIDPLLSMSYTTILQNYRRIRDHALNIAEAVAGEK